LLAILLFVYRGLPLKRVIALVWRSSGHYRFGFGDFVRTVFEDGIKLKMKRIRIFVYCSVLYSALLCSACSEVKPWERGNLAKDIMAADPYPLQMSARQHNYASREAAGAASSGAAGGGCGCN
jgi:Domain of unknown function (DUF4266)